MAFYSGIALPDARNTYPVIKDDIDLIQDSILTILLTKKGQRYFVPDFGSDLTSLLFDPNDEITSRLVTESIRVAIKEWEPRVDLIKLDTSIDDSTLYVKLTLRDKKINKIFDLALDISRSKLNQVI